MNNFTAHSMKLLAMMKDTDTAVVAVAATDGLSYFISTQLPKATPFVMIARSLLDQAAELLDETARTPEQHKLLRQARAALKELPDPNADDDDADDEDDAEDDDGEKKEQ